MAVSAKRVRVSANGTDFFTLPGNTAEFQNDGQELDDTIFGQLYKSGFPGLINWTTSASAFYKGFAGYQAVISTYSASTVMTTEATTVVVAGAGGTWQITNAVKRIVNRAVTVVVADTGGTIAASNIQSFDYLFGIVKFIGAFTPSGAVTITGAYFATITQLQGTKDFTLTMTAEAVDETDLATAQGNSGHRVFSQGLKTVQFEGSGFYDLTNGFRLSLVARAEVIIEVKPVGGTATIFRGYFRYINQGQGGDVGALEEETVTASLSVPEDPSSNPGITTPFSVGYTTTTLSTAVQIVIAGFLSGDSVEVRYLPDGTTGLEGDTIITECTLDGGVESMNMFQCSFQGTGAVRVV